MVHAILGIRPPAGKGGTGRADSQDRMDHERSCQARVNERLNPNAFLADATESDGKGEPT